MINIKKLKKREIEIMAIISKTGAITYEFINEKFGVSKRRLDDLQHSKYLEMHTVYQKKDYGFNTIYIYKLGSKGKKFVIDNNICIAIQGFSGYRHTLTMQVVVYKLIYKENIQIQNILNEKEQMIFFSKQIKDAKLRNLDYRVNDLAVIYIDVIRSIEIDSGYNKKIQEQHKIYAEQVLNALYEIVF